MNNKSAKQLNRNKEIFDIFFFTFLLYFFIAKFSSLKNYKKAEAF